MREFLFFMQLVREAHSDKVIFEQRYEEYEGTSHQAMRRNRRELKSSRGNST